MAAALSVAGCGSAPNAVTTDARPAAAGSAASAGASVASGAGPDALPSSCPAWLAAQQRGEGRLYRVDAADSQVRIHVFRAGRLAKVGHNHVLGVERLAGQVFLPADGIAGASVELAFRLDDVGIDKPEWRAGLGAEFASVPTASDVAGTRTNMLRAIDGERFPSISLRSTAVAGAFPVLAVKLAVRWHGQVREIDVPVRIARPSGEAPLRAQGALVLRQSEFGITPFSVLGGLLAIQDELTVDVDVAARAAKACD
ncbi:YceI family protein [Roseateles chitinivorans]|uniref:YceI family protein n=1 Tax=Roseateles chitinivorans TaxID=2917965 RepID=UPI003D67C2C4